jgi:hypothetical protein
MRRLLPLTLALLFSAPAWASDPTPPTATTSTDTPVAEVTVPGVTPPADDPIVCRAQPDTGSRIAPRKDCRKRSEWANKAKARLRTPSELRLGDCGGGDSSCNNAPLPSGN